MIQDLRFVERDGKRILQMALQGSVDSDGGICWEWEDVPLEVEVKDDPDGLRD